MAAIGLFFSERMSTLRFLEAVARRAERPSLDGDASARVGERRVHPVRGSGNLGGRSRVEAGGTRGFASRMEQRQPAGLSRRVRVDIPSPALSGISGRDDLAEGAYRHVGTRGPPFCGDGAGDRGERPFGLQVRRVSPSLSVKKNMQRNLVMGTSKGHLESVASAQPNRCK